MRLDLDTICRQINGELMGDNRVVVNGISTDSRLISPGSLFVALKGENFDGHDYVAQAFAKGAAAAVVERNETWTPESLRGKGLIKVPDTLLGLQKIAACWRTNFAIPLIAITGSVGKTTTKDLIASCLGITYNTLKTQGNYNNDIGLPLTLLRLNEEHQAAVVEMAMRQRGEIGRLSRIAKPTVAVIINAEPVHLETLGTIENIIRAKCEILEGLAKEGFALVNGDNPELVKIARSLCSRVLTFGQEPSCDYQIVKAEADIQGMTISARLIDHQMDFQMLLPSLRLAHNVIAAVAVAHQLGLGYEAIKKGIAKFSPTGNRLNIIKTSQGGLVINDTYNANPVSMANALETAHQLDNENRLVAVLGDMFELGSFETEGHLKVGEKAALCNPKALIAIGERAKIIAQGAIQAGMPREQVFWCHSKEEGLKALINVANAEDIIIFKASRGMQMETLAQEWIRRNNGEA
jgi:UDP-N-acetylmuramoyl-tripeptide--D-alanyl-D-alanine ligase